MQFYFSNCSTEHTMDPIANFKIKTDEDDLLDLSVVSSYSTRKE